ncbi:MAG: NAD(P)-dependent oxidoreductase [Lachnospiraceae bacterium]|nr:NAD(P)-dependent oxidoreductase [Lachnospiraceae bacterium]
MRKIIIDGATSMLGVALTEVAVREGVEVYAIVRPNTKRIDRIPKSPFVHVAYGSLDKLANAKDLPGDADVFYHFAWVGTVKAERNDPRMQERNIEYTLDAVELAERCGCKRFVFAGSQAEYGPVFDRIDDNTKHSPVLAYGIAKYAAGILSRRLCESKEIEHIWGRVFSVYGPHDNEGTMLKYAIDCWNKGEVAKFSSAMQYWNYLYELDAGEMFYRLGLPLVPAGTYMVANSESEILRNYIETAMRVYGEKAKAEFAPETSEKLCGLNVDTEKTNRLLNYYPQIAFDEGIRKMIEWEA